MCFVLNLTIMAWICCYIIGFILLVGCLCSAESTEEVHIFPETDNIWIRESRPLNLTCMFTGYHIRDVTWQVNGSEIKNELGAHVTKQRTWTFETSYITVTYYKNGAEFTDTGNYSCHAGPLSKTIEVKVTKGRLRIRPDVDKVIIMASKPFTLVCVFEGKDLLPVTWHKNGMQAFGFMTRGYVVKPNTFSKKVAVSSEISELFAKRENSGEYTCIAGPFSKTLTLEVSEEPCQVALVKSLPDVSITASSHYEDTLYSDAPSRGRLDTVREGDITAAQAGIRKILGGSWQASITDKRQWIQIAFPQLAIVTQIVTQGRSSTDCCTQRQWITQYKVLFSKDGRRWDKYKELKTGETKIFEGNHDHDTKNKHELPVPVIARFLRINPVSWSEKISLRVEAFGCTMPSTLKMIYPLKQVNYYRTDESFQITCAFDGPEPPMFRWMKNERDLHLDSTFMKVIDTSYNHDGVTTRETLLKSRMKFKDSGSYICKDENSKLYQSVEINAAELDIIPEVDRMWVTAGQPINIQCSYRGSGRNQINWQINGQSNLTEFTSNLKYDNLVDSFFVGANISKIASRSDTVDISCMVATLRKTVSVRVIAEKLKSVVLIEGETTTLDCSDIGHIDDVKNDVFWTKEHVPLNKVSDLTGRYEYYSETRRLTISNSKLSDAGRYECNVLVEVGSSQQRQISIPADVVVAPTITVEGQSSILPGSTLHIFCHITGYPVPSITWYRNGGPILAEPERYIFHLHEGSDKGHLEVHDVTPEDTGKYTCTGQGGLFPVVRKSLDVHVAETGEGRTVLILGVLGSLLSTVIVICCSAGFVRIRRRRRQRTETLKALEKMSATTDQLSKTVEREEEKSKFISKPFDLCTTDERINLAGSLPELPDGASHPAQEESLDDDTGSETYEKYERPMHAHTFPTHQSRSYRK
ncbi:hemicentin-2-like isoform X2 [Mizuhopecten yessoensis]|uniref:hemicentin-2-like isoform X2 n=1 Tax=Mizuhopecten yessoensis TaxID=6573 RepID=UPI000B459BFA|nr:hemicentin-2-like isoform X2 [Mizuhopecten yessoensis]